MGRYDTTWLNATGAIPRSAPPRRRRERAAVTRKREKGERNMPEMKSSVEVARFGTELERLDQLQAMLNEVETKIGVIQREMGEVGSLLFKIAAALTLRREVVQGPKSPA